ncbi:MAG TPA: hypothetical protein VIK33_08585 [Anaerolineae bacterium]
MKKIVASIVASRLARQRPSVERKGHGLTTVPHPLEIRFSVSYPLLHSGTDSM